jgi:hypothetical protein
MAAENCSCNNVERCISSRTVGTGPAPEEKVAEQCQYCQFRLPIRCLQSRRRTCRVAVIHATWRFMLFKGSPCAPALIHDPNVRTPKTRLAFETPCSEARALAFIFLGLCACIAGAEIFCHACCSSTCSLAAKIRETASRPWNDPQPTSECARTWPRRSKELRAYSCARGGRHAERQFLTSPSL